MSSSLVLIQTLLLLAAPAGDVQALLRKADGFRLPSGATQVESVVESYRSGALDKERRYLVYTETGRRSLVVSRSPVEKGQKVLMVGDDFWMVLPSTQRPIRITPAQKLLGDASVGDIATMAWAEDYDGVVAGEVEVGSVPCLRLDLHAQRRGVTYQRIELFVARSDGRPVQADLHVASERLAKRAAFSFETVDGRPLVSTMTLFDEIQTSRKTVIRYVSRRSRAIPGEWFNPMFLARNEPRD